MQQTPTQHVDGAAGADSATHHIEEEPSHQPPAAAPATAAALSDDTTTTTAAAAANAAAAAPPPTTEAQPPAATSPAQPAIQADAAPPMENNDNTEAPPAPPPAARHVLLTSIPATSIPLGVTEEQHKTKKQWIVGRDTITQVVRYLKVTVTPSDCNTCRLRPPKEWYTSFIREGRHRVLEVRPDFDATDGQSSASIEPFFLQVFFYKKYPAEFYIQGTSTKRLYATMGIEPGDLLKMTYEQAGTADQPPLATLSIAKRPDNPHAAALLGAVADKQARKAALAAAAAEEAALRKRKNGGSSDSDEETDDADGEVGRKKRKSRKNSGWLKLRYGPDFVTPNGLQRALQRGQEGGDPDDEDYDAGNASDVEVGGAKTHADWQPERGGGGGGANHGRNSSRSGGGGSRAGMSDREVAAEWAARQAALPSRGRGGGRGGGSAGGHSSDAGAAAGAGDGDEDNHKVIEGIDSLAILAGVAGLSNGKSPLGPPALGAAADSGGDEAQQQNHQHPGDGAAAAAGENADRIASTDAEHAQSPHGAGSNARQIKREQQQQQQQQRHQPPPSRPPPPAVTLIAKSLIRDYITANGAIVGANLSFTWERGTRSAAEVARRLSTWGQDHCHVAEIDEQEIDIDSCIAKVVLKLTDTTSATTSGAGFSGKAAQKMIESTAAVVEGAIASLISAL